MQKAIFIHINGIYVYRAYSHWLKRYISENNVRNHGGNKMNWIFCQNLACTPADTHMLALPVSFVPLTLSACRLSKTTQQQQNHHYVYGHLSWATCNTKAKQVFLLLLLLLVIFCVCCSLLHFNNHIVHNFTFYLTKIKSVPFTMCANHVMIGSHCNTVMGATRFSRVAKLHSDFRISSQLIRRDYSVVFLFFSILEHLPDDVVITFNSTICVDHIYGRFMRYRFFIIHCCCCCCWWCFSFSVLCFCC